MRAQNFARIIRRGNLPPEFLRKGMRVKDEGLLILKLGYSKYAHKPQNQT
jgi:hypothetical protein